VSLAFIIKIYLIFLVFSLVCKCYGHLLVTGCNAAVAKKKKYERSVQLLLRKMELVLEVFGGTT